MCVCVCACGCVCVCVCRTGENGALVEGDLRMMTCHLIVN